MEVALNSLNSLLSVNRRRSANDNSLQAGVRDHILVLGVQRHAMRLQVLLCPRDFLGVWRECSDEGCAWRAV
jgi:hypothetical protein